MQMISKEAEVSTHPELANQYCGRVLVVEDSSTCALTISAQLKRLGLEADWVNTGTNAFKAVCLKPYDLILMDVGLPVMDGLDASRLMRSQGIRTPIVAVTGQYETGDSDLCFSHGMDDFLCKPVRFNTLEHLIARWI
jgi:CheY-like chemotaxis protein